MPGRTRPGSAHQMGGGLAAGVHGGRPDPVLGEREQVGAAALPRTRRRRAHEVHPQAGAERPVLADELVELGAPEHVAAAQPAPHGARRAGQRVRAGLLRPRPQPQRASHVARGERERPEVRARDEVDRHAHERRLHHGPLDERVGQRLPLEALEPGPQADVHRRRVLRLDPADRLERPWQRHPAAVEQQLAREQRPVELAPRQGAHATRPLFSKSSLLVPGIDRTVAESERDVPNGSRRTM